MRRHYYHRPRDVDPFPAEIRQEINSLIGKTDALLRELRQPGLPLHLYHTPGSNSSRASEILEDCRTTESPVACSERVDRMNRGHIVRTFLQNMRDTLMAAFFDRAVC